MANASSLFEQVLRQAQGALALQLAFIGVANGLFEALDRDGPLDSARLAAATGMDPAYVARWADAAYAFEHLELDANGWILTETGRAFLPGRPGTLMPFAVQAVLSAHMSERAAGLMRTGERPGEKVLEERENILPWFGPMLEHTFGPLFEREVLPGVPVYREVDARGGVVVDLGCGNGWYLRRLAARHPHVRGVGLDGFAENIEQARAAAEREGLGERLDFREGDIHNYVVDEPVDVIAMNRALHHVWEVGRDAVFAMFRDRLKPGGCAVIWEPRWPDDITALRDPRRRGMAFHNLSEHVQGNHFLRPAEVEEAFRAVGMSAETWLFADGAEMVVVGRKA